MFRSILPIKIADIVAYGKVKEVVASKSNVEAFRELDQQFVRLVEFDVVEEFKGASAGKKLEFFIFQPKDAPIGSAMCGHSMFALEKNMLTLVYLKKSGELFYAEGSFQAHPNLWTQPKFSEQPVYRALSNLKSGMPMEEAVKGLAPVERLMFTEKKALIEKNDFRRAGKK